MVEEALLTCDICGALVFDFEPMTHLNGLQLDYEDRPSEPYVCSIECGRAAFAIEGVFEKRRLTYVPQTGGKHRIRNSKLDERQVLEIRQRYNPEIKGHQRVLGKEFGVKGNTICYIVNRKTWTHI